MTCPKCRTINEPGSIYCFKCGLPIAGLDWGVLGGAPKRLHDRFRLPLRRVLIMSVVSAGLYLLYWFYLTWRQYRDSTGLKAYPVWHALTLFVPIYNLFRIHAHMRAYSEAMSAQNLVSTISPGWAVVAVLASIIVSYFEWWSGPNTQLEAQVNAVLSLVSVAIVALLLVWVQSNLNRYWSHVQDNSASAPFGVVEVILAVIGILIWVIIIASVMSESYRLAL